MIKYLNESRVLGGINPEVDLEMSEW